MPSADTRSLVKPRLSQAEVDAICVKRDRLWSSKPGGARAVFAFKDMSGIDLSGRNLCDADFSGAVMISCNLRGVRLDNAILFCADLTGSDVREATLRRADLRGSCMRNADLTGANLERSKLSGAMAARADFTDAILKWANLRRANLKQAILKGVNLSGADLSGADLSGADLRDATLVGATILSWNVTDANISGVLTDEPAGRVLSQLPYEVMIKDHARWCETGGGEGKPSSFDGTDLRALSSIAGYNLTALSAKGTVFYGLNMEGVQ